MIEAVQNPLLNLKKMIDQIEASSLIEPPCRYTKKDAVERVIEATADVDTGKGLLTLEEFEIQVASLHSF